MKWRLKIYVCEINLDSLFTSRDNPIQIALALALGLSMGKADDSSAGSLCDSFRP